MTATGLDLEARRMLTSEDADLRYDSLLIATGSTPRRLTLPGSDLDGVQYLRRLEDSDCIRAAFAGTPRVVIVGAGWIGLERSASVSSPARAGP